MSELITSRPVLTSTPGYGDTAFDLLHYRQALRIGDRVEISGQGGWDDDLVVADDLTDEIVRAFDNVERTLATVGTTWRDVVSMDSFHRVADGERAIGDDHNRVMVAEVRRRMGDRAPIWTQVGVTAFGLATMNVEIRVAAVVTPHDA